jgi:hypothetical protein
VDRGKSKWLKQGGLSKTGGASNKPEMKVVGPTNNLWRERQLRDYREANGLCFYCGDKFDPSHVEVCQKRTKA